MPGFSGEPSFLRSERSERQKRIIDANSAQYCAVLKVFTVEKVRAR